MATLKHEWFGVSRDCEYRIVPIGDIHIGNKGCVEKQLAKVIQHVQETDNCYWIGMGDMCDFINMKDPRFAVDELAGWVKREHLGDLVAAQRDRLLEMLEPIAHKCLGLVEGNHERSILRYTERDVYSEIVSAIKTLGKFDPETKLALGYAGWIMLSFHRGEKRRSGTATVKINVHHGFVGGKLAGAKALNMQRWLWNHEADIVVFGHSHNTGTQTEAVEVIDRNGNVRIEKRVGCYSGTFLHNAGYAQVKGYFPLPIGGVEIIIKPYTNGNRSIGEQIRIVTT